MWRGESLSSARDGFLNRIATATRNPESRGTRCRNSRACHGSVQLQSSSSSPSPFRRPVYGAECSNRNFPATHIHGHNRMTGLHKIPMIALSFSLGPAFRHEPLDDVSGALRAMPAHGSSRCVEITHAGADFQCPTPARTAAPPRCGRGGGWPRRRSSAGRRGSPARTRSRVRSSSMRIGLRLGALGDDVHAEVVGERR